MTGTVWDPVIMGTPVRLHNQVHSLENTKFISGLQSPGCKEVTVEATIAVTTSILYMHWFGESEC